jgi:nucleotide-binding universal stress UspA family protein
MLRTILVTVDCSAAGHTRLKAAVALASRFKCSLTGAFLRSDLYPRYVVSDGIVPLPADVLDGMVAERTIDMDRASLAARRLFDEAVQETEVPFHWLDINGDGVAQLAACARRHDLTVLPPEIKTAFGDRTIAASQIGMAAGGPVLVLKHGGYPLNFGKKILVAWNDSREAARALRDAWPFLAGAEEIHFLTVSPHAESELDTLLQRQLRHHGCKVGKTIVDRSEAASVGDVIKLHVGETGADMVVMGLYGRSRLQELVLGGVSKDLLRDPPMPLLLSH